MTYRHNNKDPNLNNLHHAMEYQDDLPHLRVTLGSDNITITGDVNLVDTVTVNSTPEDPVHTHITEVGTSGILAVPYMPIGGTVDANVTFPSIYKISKDTNANSDSNRIFVNASGTVELGTTTLSALENITVSGSVSVSNFPATQAVTGTFWQATQPVSIATMPTTPVTGTFWQAIQPVSGTVTIQDGGGSITVDGTVTANVTFPTTQQVSGTVALDTASLTALENVGVTGTVELGTTTLAALENITVSGSVSVGNFPASQAVTGTFWQTTQPVSGTVSIGTDGTVSLSAASLSALENISATVSGTIELGATTLSALETVTVNQGTNPWTVSPINTTTNSGSFEWQVARGAVTGAVAVNVFGHQDLISITPWAVWDRAADYVFPTTASQLTVVSTSATDNNTCRVTIYGLDANWNPLVEQVALTGTSNVITAGTFLRINQMLMTAPATGQVSNVGTITAKIGATIYAQINPGIGKTQMAVYSVAAGKSFYLTQITALAGSATGTSKYMNFQAVIKNNLTGVSFTLLQATWQNVYQVQRVVPLAYGEKQDIKWQLYTNSGDYPASIIVEGALLTN